MKNPLVSVVIVSKDRKKDLIECLNSYFNSSYKNIEVIVVDNSSSKPLSEWVLKKYPKVKLITSNINIGAAAGRNRGFELSKGEYILFTDDDAYADKKMIEYLLDAFKKKKDAGIIQPLVYDKQKKDILQGAGHDIDLISGRIKASGVREKDRGQYDGIREVPMCGCVWMVKRKVFDRIGSYDEDYFIPYEDCDFSIRARKNGFKLYCTSEAKTWHQGVKTTYVHPWVEWLGITTPERAYRVVRNKTIFMRKHSPFPKNIVFFLLLLPIYIVLHSLIILISGRFDILSKYLLGVLSGIWYSLTYPIRGIFRRIYFNFDKNLHPLKIYLMAWTDPLPWVIDKSAKTILDLGCGVGEPMQLIRHRMKIKKAVGVDLFKPYLEKAKSMKIHDQYIIKDVRKVSFKPGSFDVVMASHVIEHLPKDDAWKLLKKMELTAKKQVIIATPIGEHYHPAVDNNILQLHLSDFSPKEFVDRGYKVVKYEWKWLLGDKGLVHKINNDILRKVLFVFNILATPLYYLFPDSSDYVFVAYKNINKNEDTRKVDEN